MSSKITTDFFKDASHDNIIEYIQAVNDKLKANIAETLSALCRYMNEHKGYQIMFGVEEVNTIHEADINAFIDHIQFSEYVPITGHDNYEIATTYPYNIREIKTKIEVNEYIIGSGYIGLQLNKKQYYKHRILAQQFLSNPNNYPFVDHINKNRSDYHIENLRYVSCSENNLNRISTKGVKYDYIHELPKDAKQIISYEGKSVKCEFIEGMYYYSKEEDKYYQQITNNNYKILHINIICKIYPAVSLFGSNNKRVAALTKYLKFAE